MTWKNRLFSSTMWIRRQSSDSHAWRQTPSPVEPLVWPWEGCILVHSALGQAGNGVEFVARVWELKLLLFMSEQTGMEKEDSKRAGL